MRVIIAGGRDVVEYKLVEDAINNSGFEITEVVSGACCGVDCFGEYWAHLNKIPVKRFPADWNKHGKSAGPIRNKQMAEYVGSSGGLIAVCGGKGTLSMINITKQIGIKTFTYCG